MTDPTPQQHTADPVAVILARMEVKLDNALTEQARHTSIIERHDTILGEHGNRLTALETRTSTDDQHHERTISARMAFWAAAAAVVMFASLLATLLLVPHH